VRHMLLLVFAAGALMAADATGKWSGTLTLNGPDGQTQPSTAYLVLKQEGAKLTGTAGQTAGEQREIVDGKVENGKITFGLPLGPATMKFVLEQTGDSIAGDVSAEADGQKLTAKLAVKLEK
jgi:hypothetical protein